MYKHIGTSYTFENQDGEKVYLRMIPSDEPGTTVLITSKESEVINRREIVHTAGAADLQVQSGTKWAGEQLFAGILEAELNKKNKTDAPKS